MHTKRRAVALAVALLAALGSAAAPAGASDRARVAVDAEGTAHFSWLHDDNGRPLVQGLSREPDGTLGDIHPLSSPTRPALYAEVLAGAAGTAVHHWVEATPAGNVVRARSRSADGAFSATQTVSEPGVNSAVRAAADGAGNVTFAWTRTVGGKVVVEARRRAAGGTLGTVQRVSASAPSFDAYTPDVAVDGAGRAVITWVAGGSPSYVQIRRRSPNGTMTDTQNLTSGGGPAYDPRIGVDGAGHAVVAFRRAVAGGYAIQVRRRSAAGVLGSTQTVSSTFTQSEVPHVSVSPSAGAVVAWRQLVNGSYRVQATRRPPGGEWAATAPVSPAGAFHTNFTMGIDAGGNALFLMRHATGGLSHLQLRRRAADGTLGTVQDLTPPDGQVGGSYLAVEAGGGAVAAWIAADRTGSYVHARRRSAEGELSETQELSY